MDRNDELKVAACGSVDVDRWWRQIQDVGGGHHSLLIRRSSDGKLAYYLTWHTQPVAFADLVAVAGRQWIIEEAFQITKDQFGLGQTQVRALIQRLLGLRWR